MKEQLIINLKKVAKTLGIEEDLVKLEYPETLEYGDITTNIALIAAKKLSKKPNDVAEMIMTEMGKNLPDFVESVSVAGAGFINFEIKDKIFAEQIVKIAGGDPGYGKAVLPVSADTEGKVLVEYTDPNTFKVFHVGHLMNNAIGESISRIIEFAGSQVVRICYPSDIGLHIAKTIWAMQEHSDKIPGDSVSTSDKTEFLGEMYVEGTREYESDPAAKKDIDALNEVIYARSSSVVNALYDKGRGWSLEHFDTLFATLGTKFDDIIFESEMAPVGLKIVRDFLKKGVFEESEGAVVFKGEKYGLHTRVFVNSHGLPTYEGKEVGLNVTKFKKYPDTRESIIVTANEQNEYFKVVTKALSAIDEGVSGKMMHIGHGMLRFSSGKMSSRTGNVVTAEHLIEDVKRLVSEKMANRDLSGLEKKEISETVAIGAIKYTILRQAIGGNVAFDSVKSISFEGDSGPYLQYSAVRAQAVLDKAVQEGIKPAKSNTRLPKEAGLLDRLIFRFPDIIQRARNEYAPQLVANYLINLAGAFNSFYADQKIIDAGDELSSYRVALTKSFLITMTNGLWVLGIKVPKKM